MDHVYTNLEQKCVAAGVKMTDQRRVVLRVLADNTDHPSVEDVCTRAKAIDKTISMATVYRTLNLLEDLQLVAKHEFSESFARYEVEHDHHHHLIDVESNDVVEFGNEAIEHLMTSIARDLGFELVDHTLELYGRKIVK